MALVGRALLILGLLVALYGIGASIYGARTANSAWVDSGRRSMYALFGLMAGAFAILEWAFLSNQFSFNIVAGGSSSTTPFFYRAAAVWATQAGSIVLWILLLSLWSSLILFITRRRVREVAPIATAVLLGFCAFFLTLTVIVAKPFATTANAPIQGVGLDPLLQHTTMMIHPPMLYSGYTMLAIPFAFAVGALISGRLNAEWIQVTRRFALGAWLFLGIGILLGARWSYTELGWGGYWAWDPVENAALMPWLLATAFIHSVMIQEKRGMLKIWNVSLILGTGTMSIIGTFLVRSGILSSIHAFVSDPTLNIAFVLLIATMLCASIGLVIWRRDHLRSEARLDSLLSREAMFIYQNLILVTLTVVIFWVTFFPLISEAITGTEVSVGPPAFRPFVVPLALIIVLLMGIGPLIPWRRVTAANLRRQFTIPVLVGAVTLIVLLIRSDADTRPLALTMFTLGAFVLATVAREVWRGTAARRASTGDAVPLALFGLIRRNRRRYGGYTVHAGLAVLLIGVAGSSSFQHSNQVTLAPGQSAMVDGYKVTYARPIAQASAAKLTFGSVLNVTKNGRHVTTLTTTRSFYPDTADPSAGPISEAFAGNADSQVGLQSGFTRDIWSVVDPNLQPLQPLINQGDKVFLKFMTGLTASQARNPTTIQDIEDLRARAITEITERYVTHPWPVQFLLIVSPLVMWIWLGALIMAGGALIALWPLPVAARRRAIVRSTAKRRAAPTPAPVRETV